MIPQPLNSYTKTLQQHLFAGGDILDDCRLMVLGHGEKFKKLFIDYYYDRQVGYETFAAFKKKLDVMFNLLLPRYNQLYLSTCIIDNPFMNRSITTKNHHKGGQRGKKVGTADGESLMRAQGQQAGYSDNFASRSETDLRNKQDSTQNVQKDINATKANAMSDKDNRSFDMGLRSENDSSENVQQTKSAAKDKGTLDETTNTTTLFSDTPQSKVYTTIEELWNNGYLTTAQNVFSTHNQKTSGTHATGNTTYGGVKEFKQQGWEESKRAGEVGYTNNGEAGGATTYGGTKLYSQESDETVGRESNLGRNATDTANKQNTKVLSNFLNADISIDEAIDHFTDQGFDGRSVSSMLLEYRDTFINIDYDFIKEFEPLFLGVF